MIYRWKGRGKEGEVDCIDGWGQDPLFEESRDDFDCMAGGHKSEVTIEGDFVKNVKIHYMRPFSTGKDRDHKLRVGEHWNVHLMTQAVESTSESIHSMYIDDPANPIVSGATIIKVLLCF